MRQKWKAILRGLDGRSRGLLIDLVVAGIHALGYIDDKDAVENVALPGEGGAQQRDHKQTQCDEEPAAAAVEAP